jgi:UDPglucose--hexose-1-phosphate uridylyltransferase
MVLADLIKKLTARYDNLFGSDYHYTMGFHQAPTDGQRHEEWHFHAHFHLHNKADEGRTHGRSVAIPHLDITPEMAASRLREI